MNTESEAGGHRLCEFAAQVDFDALHKVVRSQVRRVVLDTLGCMIAGVSTPIGQQMHKLAGDFPQPAKGASVVGLDFPVTPLVAANANGAIANVLDGDDGHRMAAGHPSGVIIPAALAAAQMRGANGRRLIEALVAGYEVALRAGMVLNSGTTYHGSGHWCTYGAAAAAGNLLGLDSARMRQAFGIVEIQTPSCGLMGWIESRRIPTIKEGMGWAAATGLMSAMMAAAGVTGTATIFGDSIQAPGTDPAGGDYEITRLYFKPYPCCRWTHAAIDHMLDIVRSRGIAAADIAAIDVATFKRGALLDTIVPDCIEQAQYSTPFLLAVAAIDGQLSPEQMVPERFGDPQVRRLAQRVNLRVDPAIEARFPVKTLARVTVTTHDGTHFEAFDEQTKGDWDIPLSDQEIAEKFRVFVAPFLPPPKTDRLIATVGQLEQLEDAGALLQMAL